MSCEPLKFKLHVVIRPVSTDKAHGKIKPCLQPTPWVGKITPCLEGDPINNRFGSMGGGAPAAPGPRPLPPPGLSGNEEISVTLSCPPGTDGPSVTVTVPVNAYLSPIPGRATAIALAEAQAAAVKLLSCEQQISQTVVPVMTFCFQCGNFPLNGNYAKYQTEPGEFVFPDHVTLEEAVEIVRGLLLEEAFEQLDCSLPVCQEIDGNEVEASLPFEQMCVGGTWFSDPFPEYVGRWEVASSPDPADCDDASLVPVE